MKASVVSMLRYLDALCGAGTLYLIFSAPTPLIGLRESVPLLVVGFGLSLVLAGHMLFAPLPPVSPTDGLDRIGPVVPSDRDDHWDDPDYPNAA